MSFVTGLLAEWCVNHNRELPESYLQIVEAQCLEIEPSFITSKFGDRFREITANRDYFSKQHLHSAVEESFGAKRLLNIISELPPAYSKLASKFERHATEEIGHHGIFIEIFDNVFSDYKIGEKFRAEIESCIPDLSEAQPNGRELDVAILFMEVVQINIGELRNLVQLKLAKPILEAHALDEEAKSVAQRLMDQLISDEGGHVYYTAKIIEDFISDGHETTITQLIGEGIKAFDDDARKAMWPDQFDSAQTASIPS